MKPSVTLTQPMAKVLRMECSWGPSYLVVSRAKLFPLTRCCGGAFAVGKREVGVRYSSEPWNCGECKKPAVKPYGSVNIRDEAFREEVETFLDPLTAEIVISRLEDELPSITRRFRDRDKLDAYLAEVSPLSLA